MLTEVIILKVIWTLLVLELSAPKSRDSLRLRRRFVPLPEKSRDFLRPQDARCPLRRKAPANRDFSAMKTGKNDPRCGVPCDIGYPRVRLKSLANGDARFWCTQDHWPPCDLDDDGPLKTRLSHGRFHQVGQALIASRRLTHKAVIKEQSANDLGAATAAEEEDDDPSEPADCPMDCARSTKRKTDVI